MPLIDSSFRQCLPVTLYTLVNGAMLYVEEFLHFFSTIELTIDYSLNVTHKYRRSRQSITIPMTKHIAVKPNGYRFESMEYALGIILFLPNSTMETNQMTKRTKLVNKTVFLISQVLAKTSILQEISIRSYYMYFLRFFKVPI